MDRPERLWRIALGVALVLSLLSLVLGQWEQHRRRSQAGRWVTVVHAARSAAAGEVLVPEALVERTIPLDHAPGARIERVEEAVGRSLATFLPAGAALRPTDFLDPPPLREDERMVNLPLSAGIPWAGFLRRGDHVDVLAAFQLQGEPATMVLVQDAIVLAAPERQPGGLDAERLLAGPVALGSEAVTLLVSTEQALRLAHAVSFGEDLLLIVRPPSAAASLPPEPIRGSP